MRHNLFIANTYRGITISSHHKFSILFICVLGFIGAPVAIEAAVQPPVLKWAYGGCYSSWCERGWYSSANVLDVNGDGTLDVIGSAYSVVALEGNSGTTLWRANSGHSASEGTATNVGRTWPAIVVEDVNNDGAMEIVTAHGGGYVSLYDSTGELFSGWPKRPIDSELRGLLVTDLDGDHTSEILVNAAVGSETNSWLFEHDGSLRSGWPQLTTTDGYSYGVFHDNAAAGDLNNDGMLDLVVPSDVHYICAYNGNGTQLDAHSMYGAKKWGAVGIWEDFSVELRGWGRCDGGRAESYRTNFAHGPAVVADVNGDNIPEVVVTGNVYNCDVGHPPGKYTGLYIFNGDRSRFNTGGFDWNTVPVDTGAPISEDYNEIENCQPNPVVADIDGDGNSEILFASYDGRVHVFWLDKTEHHNWPYSVYNAAEGYKRFASEPVVADIDNDGHAEIIFGSWVEKNTGQRRLGKLHVLDYQGNVLHELELPVPKSSSIDWNGVLAAPTLANIDGDDDLEVILNTSYSGFVTYDLPGSAQAKILWKSGRAGRIWRKKVLSKEERLQTTITTLKVLSGVSISGQAPDTDESGKTDMADAIINLKEAVEP